MDARLARLPHALFPLVNELLQGQAGLVFIRAPRIESVGKDVEVLAKRGNDPVLVRQGRVLAATFHPELSPDTRVHEEFLKLVRG